MNFRIIAYIVGWVCNFQAIFMVLPCITALVYQEHEFFAFLISMILCLIVGIPLTARKPKNKVFYTKDGCVAVALSWLALCIFGSVPFVLSNSIPHPIDAFFETVSGFTTTGSSILTDVEVLPHCILMWRSFTHWIGGMGVLVFLLSLLPLAGGYHMNLMKAESPGPSVSKLVPKVQQTAKILYSIYIGMTLLQIVLLLIGNIPLFDTLCIAFGTAGTGGFGIRNDSMGSYSTYCQIVTTIFMILFGVNFSAYYLILTKKIRQALKFEEVRYYFGIIAAAILVIGLNTMHLFQNLGVSIQQAAPLSSSFPRHCLLFVCAFFREIQAVSRSECCLAARSPACKKHHRYSAQNSRIEFYAKKPAKIGFLRSFCRSSTNFATDLLQTTEKGGLLRVSSSICKSESVSLLRVKKHVGTRKSRLPFQVNGLTFGGALSTALEPNTSSREMVLESSVKLKLSTTRSSKT